MLTSCTECPVSMSCLTVYCCSLLGNGYIGSVVNGESQLFLKYGRSLSQPVNYYPIIHVHMEGLPHKCKFITWPSCKRRDICKQTYIQTCTYTHTHTHSCVGKTVTSCYFMWNSSIKILLLQNLVMLKTFLKPAKHRILIKYLYWLYVVCKTSAPHRSLWRPLSMLIYVASIMGCFRVMDFNLEKWLATEKAVVM